MSKKNEDSIERFFRKAVTQHDTAFRESDWLKMEKMLEQKAAERAAIRSANLRRAAYSLIILAVISLSVYFLAFNGKTSLSTEEVLPKQMQVAAGEEAPGMDKTKEDPAAGLHSPAPSDHVGDETATGKNETKENPATDGSLTSREGIIAKENSAAQPSLLKDRDAGVKKSPAAEDTRSAVENIRSKENRTPVHSDHRSTTAGKSETPAGSQNVFVQPPAILENSTSKNNTPSREGGNESPRQISPGLETVTGEGRAEKPVGASEETTTGADPILKTTGSKTSHPSFQGDKSFQGDDKNMERSADLPVLRRERNKPQEEASALPAGEQEPEKAPLPAQTVKDSTSIPEEATPESLPPAEETRSIPTRWTVALALAPDFSSTALERYTSPGEAYGLMVGYQFLSRFTVSTGLARSTKKYVGYGSDYQPPEGYWQHRTNGIIPDDIKGTCAILEIPLMVQYTVKQREKSRIYIAAGLSSYIMMHESYEYTFETPNPGAARGWSTSKSSTYPFAIGHLSAAYERQLSPRWTIGLEPFLKIPFAGVGWSNVDLYSTGMFINLRYRLFRKQQFTVSEERKTTQQ